MFDKYFLMKNFLCMIILWNKSNWCLRYIHSVEMFKWHVLHIQRTLLAYLIPIEFCCLCWSRPPDLKWVRPDWVRIKCHIWWSPWNSSILSCGRIRYHSFAYSFNRYIICSSRDKLVKGRLCGSWWLSFFGNISFTYKCVAWI